MADNSLSKEIVNQIKNNQANKNNFQQDKSQIEKAYKARKEEKEREERIKEEKRIKERNENRYICEGGLCQVCGGYLYGCMPMIGD